MKLTEMTELSAASSKAIVHETRLRYIAYYLEFSEKHRYDYDVLEMELANVLNAADFCIEQGNLLQLVSFARNLGDYLFAAGLWPAYMKYASALLAAHAVMDTGERLQLISRLAEIEQARGNYDRAEHLYRQQLQDIEQIQISGNDIAAKILGRLAKLVLLQGKKAEALHYLTEQLTASSSRKERVDIILDTVDLYIKGQQFDRAEQMCNEGIEIARSIGYTVGEIDLLRHLATTSWSKGDANRALELYQICHERASGTGDQERLDKIQEEIRYLQSRKEQMMLNDAIVRIYDTNRRVVGAGFLVAEKHILTCAHVVSQALRKYDADIPSEDVYLDFPLAAPETTHKSRVVIWQPQEDTDLAGLELLTPLPANIQPVRLVAEDSINLWGHSFRTYGFPRGYESGVWSAGVLRGPTATNDWLQIESGQEVGFRIQPGFSGSPVWDESLRGVVGLIAASDVQSRAAFIITTSKISTVWPTLSFSVPDRAITYTPPHKREERKLKVFLCHASDDKSPVRRICRRLQSDGIAPWLDEQNLLPGQKWQLEIPRAVRSSDAVLICLSRNSVTKSGYVQKEIKIALDAADEQPEDRIFLIPVRLEECEVPDRLSSFQWVNLFDENGYERLMSALRRLARSIGIQAITPTPTEVPLGQLPSLVSILFLSSDPSDASRLRLGEELREIQEKLQLAKLRDRFELNARMSVRPADVSQALLDINPQVVHFSGHGTKGGELVFEDNHGNAHLVSSSALSALFDQFSDQVQCVILNACYSESQAQAIAEHIEYVIGTNQAIGDKAAIAFSVGFYQALGAGRTIEDAYKLGCVQIRLQGIPEHLTPILIKKGRLYS